ncbi:hypothetical protein Naga_101750g1 [Nannochloropsis gaditana]|uniref:Uncharacterized protein n=1 Tax=Nannochloropsis gaditana TaxID=72520 RepID=W7T231_9STRA|nr:hypothetical protein Naga_101750g1 [Nannochloropsis gaditana]
MYDDAEMQVAPPDETEDTFPTSRSSLLAAEGQYLLSSLYATYRALFRHLPVSVRPAGIDYLERVEGVSSPSLPLSRSGHRERCPALPSLSILRWASRRLRRSIRRCLAHVDDVIDREARGDAVAALTAQVMSVAAMWGGRHDLSPSFPIPLPPLLSILPPFLPPFPPSSLSSLSPALLASGEGK